jgi:LemA protein
MVRLTVFLFLVLGIIGVSVALPPLGAILAAVFAASLWSLYNKLAALKQMVLQQRSNIDTELTRRRDLFERLYAVVTASVSAETTVLRDVAQVRAGISHAGNQDISRGVSMLTAVAEATPDVRFNQNYLSLQEQIAATEAAIQQAREACNRAVNDYNIVITTFPNNIVAVPLPFRMEEYYAQ